MKSIKKAMILFTISVILTAWMTGCSCNGFPIPDLPQTLIGHCVYKNAFSGGDECKEYLGGWTKDEATNDCKGNGSQIVLDKKCGIEDNKRYGDCIFIVDKAKDKFARVELPGTDSSRCGSMERGCEFFGGGSFVPTSLCGGKTGQSPSGTLPVFQQPTFECKAPKAGEPAGKGPDGKVCTWSAIAGATEPGRKFEDYGNCDRVRTQRPYYPVPPAETAKDADPRLKDPNYVKELSWVKSQIQAAACVCCHSTTSPQGPSNWYLESGPNWINSMGPRGLAMGAGWINTVGFGAFPPEQNNGFSRSTPKNPSHSAFPTTDDARMRKFFENELKHRGKTKDDFKNEKYGAGPLDAQRFYEPEDCNAGQKIDKDGTIHWIGGPARYVYVMKANATSPGAPPNLDIPEGTLWRIDVGWKEGTPIESGTVKYGEVPKGLTQAFPKEGSPTPLQSGEKYYLYVNKDIANPLTRCIVTIP
jgi:hypothetical protein